MAGRRRGGTEVFTLHKDGVFGLFAVDATEVRPQQIYFLSTVMQLSELDELKTAKEVLTERDLDFDSLIQRDIVPEHVADIEAYLTRDPDDVKFFPPLLAAILPFRDRSMELKYPAPTATTTDGGEPELAISWSDVLRVKVGLPLPNEQDRLYRLALPDGLLPGAESLDVIPRLTTLDVNGNRAKLVVVDGQHRLRALRALTEDANGDHRLSGLTIPVCILWAPWAHEGTEDDLTVIQIVRRIFVDVNAKAKQVSGHFYILLNDKRLTALAIRSFCEGMRQETDAANGDLLQYIEWNEHAASRAYQLNRENALTGVGVLEQALEESGVAQLGTRRDNHLMRRIFPRLLLLDAVREELEEAGDGRIGFGEFINWKANFTIRQREILQDRIDEYLRPSLVQLFRDFAPLSRQRALIAENLAAFAERGQNYREAVRCLRQHLTPDSNQVQANLDEIDRSLRDTLREAAGLQVWLYRTQRFQQGLLAAWYTVLDAAFRESDDVEIRGVTAAWLEAMNETLFAEQDGVFGAEHPWLVDMIVPELGNRRVIKTKPTRLAVANLLLAHNAMPQVSQRIAEKLFEEEELRETFESRLVETGMDCARAYVKRYREKRTDTFERNLDYDPTLDEDERESLQELREKALARRPDLEEEDIRAAKEEFDRRVGVLVWERISPNIRGLERVLGYEIEGIPQHVDLDDDDAEDEDGDE